MAADSLTPSARLDLAVLKRAYPGLITKLLQKDGGGLVVRLADGSELPYDDGRLKTPAQLLDNPDLEDMLRQAYPLAWPGKRRPGFDPGRVRVEAFFRAAYGDSPVEVKKNLRPVDLAGRRVWFNRRFGAAEALAKAGQTLGRLLGQNPGWRSGVFPLGGTFHWRRIAGTRRLSAHSFGIALDIRPHPGGYWRWARGRTGPGHTPPRLLVRAFEAAGFIWGGKWWHFDTMHFEYRPELIIKALA